MEIESTDGLFNNHTRSWLRQALRDGVLQDLLAVSMLVKAARDRLAERDADAASDLLGHAATSLTNDLKGLRTVIRELDGTRRD